MKRWHLFRIFLIKKYIWCCLDDVLLERLLDKLDRHSKALNKYQ